MTSPAAALAALIANLGEAKEGSREFDAQIWCAVLPRDGVGIDGYGLPDEPSHFEYRPTERHPNGMVEMLVVFERGNIRTPRAVRISPAYSASLDAALMLVPEGWRWEVSTHGVNPVGQADLHFETFDATKYRREVAHAATPALALCIAALRARRSR